MDRIRKFLILGLTLPLIGAIALGCNTGTEEPDAPETGDRTGATDGGSASPRPDTPADDIDTSRFDEVPKGAAAAIPENYPADLPIYPGAVPSVGRGTSNDGTEVAGVKMLTNDPLDKTYDYYHDELESGGWTLGPAEDKNGKSLSVTKGDCKAIFMFVPAESGGGTDIITVSSCD